MLLPHLAVVVVSPVLVLFALNTFGGVGGGRCPCSYGGGGGGPCTFNGGGCLCALVVVVQGRANSLISTALHTPPVRLPTRTPSQSPHWWESSNLQL